MHPNCAFVVTQRRVLAPVFADGSWNPTYTLPCCCCILGPNNISCFKLCSVLNSGSYTYWRAQRHARAAKKSVEGLVSGEHLSSSPHLIKSLSGFVFLGNNLGTFSLSRLHQQTSGPDFSILVFSCAWAFLCLFPFPVFLAHSLHRHVPASNRRSTSCRFFYGLLRVSDLLVWVDRLTLDSVLLLRGWCRFASPPPNNTVIIRGKRTCIFRGCPNCERETGHSVMMIMDWWFFYFLTIHFAHSHPPKCHCSLALASWRSSEFSLPSQEFLPQGSWSNPLETPFKFLQPTASLPYVAILLPQGTSSFMRITILCSWMHTKLHCPKSKWLATQVPICHVSLSSLALLIFPPPPMNLWRAAIHAYATTLSALLMHSIWRQKIIICADSVISSGRGFLHFDLVLVLSFCG